MRRSQSVRRALYALVVLIAFMVVLRLLRPDNTAGRVIPYEQVAEAHAQHAAQYAAHDAAHDAAQHAAHERPAEAAAKPPVAAEPEAAAGPPFDAEAAYKEIVYGTPATPVVIFSKSYCPHSKIAKQLLLDEHAIVPTPKVVELDLHSNGAELQNYIAGLTGRRTVPNVLVNGISRGGASDMVDLGDALAAQLQEWGAGKISVEALKAHIQPV